MRYVYVEQFGYVWRLTMSEWIELCRRQSDCIDYDLDEYRRLRRPPRWLTRTEHGYRVVRNVHFVQPLDWSREDFKDELEELRTAVGQDEDALKRPNGSAKYAKGG